MTIYTRERGEMKVDILQGATDKGRAIQFWKSQTTSDYWCHGWTFDGYNAAGGAFSPFGYEDYELGVFHDSVTPILQDEGWTRICCSQAKKGDIIAYYHGFFREIVHSGKILRIATDSSGTINEIGRASCR